MKAVRPLAALVVLVVLLAGCSGTGSKQQQRASTGGKTAIEFSDCAAKAKASLRQVPTGLTFECGTLAVPLDWEHPDNGKTVDVAVVRIHSDDQRQRIGSLLVNPGGPGASGIDLALQLSQVAGPLLQRFDLVGFDPRGVGQSDGLHCISPKEKDRAVALDPDPETAAEYAEQVDLAQQIAQNCYADYGDSLSYFSTVETARDMDAIRAGLGDDKLSYLGFSYGTYLGAVYATLFPDHVRALALDGAVDPTAGLVKESLQQAAGFERAFGEFADWCRQNTQRCPIGPDARGTIEALLTRADAHPIPSSTPGETRKATDGNVLLAVISALYSQQLWPVLALAMDDARSGDSRGVLALDDRYTDRTDSGQYDNLSDANTVINCADSAQRPGPEKIRQLEGQWREQHPLFGGALAVTLLPCAEWKAPANPPPAVSAPSAATILVVGTRNDPATPYESAVTMTDQLGSAVLLTAEGEGHTAYFANACVRDAVNGYLLERKVPAKGTVCPAG